MIVGHEQVLGALERPAPVILFLGPRGVGKRATAQYLMGKWGIPIHHRLEFLTLDVPTARNLVENSRHQFAHPMYAVVRMNHASTAAQTVLLKALEETTTMRFLLLAEEPPMDTIISRAQVHMFRPLTHEQVASLLQRQGYGTKKAAALAALSDGTVRSARAAESLLEVRPAVLGAVRAIAEQDPVALDRLANKWTEQHTAMMRRWVHEVLSRNYGVYSEVDALPRPVALKILIALSSDVRPKLQVRAGLMGLVVAA